MFVCASSAFTSTCSAVLLSGHSSDVLRGDVTILGHMENMGTASDSVQESLKILAENRIAKDNIVDEVPIATFGTCQHGWGDVELGSLDTLATSAGVKLSTVEIPGLSVEAKLKLARETVVKMKLTKVGPHSCSAPHVWLGV